MAGENRPGVIMGRIVGSNYTPLADVQIDLNIVRCDTELNGGYLPLVAMNGNKLRGATNGDGVFCVGFEFNPNHQGVLMTRVYEARLVAIKWKGFEQERPAVRFSARVALALDIKSWFISGTGAPTWNNTANDATNTGTQLWATYRAAVKSADAIKSASFPTIMTMSNEHMGLVGDAGNVVMPPV